MKRPIATLLGVALVSVNAYGARPRSIPSESARASQQSPASPAGPQLPRSQLPDLGRHTKEGDTEPLFDFGKYFLGKWTFEWDVPTSPLGEGGLITGTDVFTASGDERYYESQLEANGPDGPFKAHSVIIYLRDAKVVSSYETDSRGFSLIKSGPIGGDLGGYFNIHYESAPFTYKTKRIRLRTTTHLFSPLQFNARVQISVDGGPFTNYGSPWWKRADVPIK
jgi:hypothetical protein